MANFRDHMERYKFFFLHTYDKRNKNPWAELELTLSKSDRERFTARGLECRFLKAEQKMVNRCYNRFVFFKFFVPVIYAIIEVLLEEKTQNWDDLF